ncbi:MAG TPA: hypothetical protein VFM93_02645 [Candidatus Limnocylindria bacterium]|nr:hypothetical protein [Candidatus Limnocylindria bacterium]
MADRRITDAELESLLRDVGDRLAYPDARHLATRVRARIAADRVERRRPWLFALAPALVTLLVLGAGAYATDVIRLRGIDIFRGPQPAAPVASPRIPGATRVATVEAAEARAGFRPVVPAALGRPDEIDVVTPAGGSSQVMLLYAARPGLPESQLTGVGAVVTEVRASLETALLSKIAGSGARVEQVRVAGGPAVWIEGAPHVVFYREANGNIIQDTLRLAGNVLLWERDGLLLRLEAQVGREEAVRIAESAR